MAFTEQVMTALRGFAGVQALVGNDDSPETYRIYNLVLPQSDSMPAIVFERLNVSEVKALTKSARTTRENVRLRVISYSNTLTQAIDLAAQAQLALEADSLLVTSQMTGFDDYEDDTQLYKVITDYSIWY